MLMLNLESVVVFVGVYVFMVLIIDFDLECVLGCMLII